MTAATTFFIETKIRSFLSSCATAESHIRSARTIAELVSAAELHPDALIRFSGEVRSRQQRVKNAAAAKAADLVQAMLLRVENAEADTKPRVLLEANRTLQLLRGNFPGLYTLMSRKLQEKLRANPDQQD